MAETASEYWKARMESAFLAGEKTARELSESLRGAYVEAAREIQKEIEAFYGRYAGMNGLSIGEVKMRLNPKELKSYAEETKRYYDMVDPSKIGMDMAESYRKELRYQSARSYMSRLEALKTDLKHVVMDLGGKERQGLERTLEKIYSDTYARTRCAADVYKGFSTGFARLNHDQLNSAVHQKWLGSNFSDRIWKDKGSLLDSLNTTFLQGVARGQNPRKIAEQMAERLGANYSACERLVRTEAAHVANMSTMKGYKDSGITSYKILATLDSRTSEICRDYDGKVFELKDMEVGVNAPPFHPNCRTTTIAHFAPDEIDAMFEEAQRVARDEGGRLYYVPASTTYRQWEGMMAKPPAAGLKETVRKIKSEKAKKEDVVGRKSELLKILEAEDVEEVEVKPLARKLSETEIIARVSGGDMTKGSCVSVSLAYASNKAGLDVLDFRGGKSQFFFSRTGNIRKLCELDGVFSKTMKNSNDFTAVSQILKNVKENREYFFSTGRHAAIIRRENGAFEYLELQSSRKDNGWRKLTADALKRRFRCQKSHTSYGHKLEASTFLIDIESLTKNKEFLKLMGYVNTDGSRQMKGIKGAKK